MHTELINKKLRAAIYIRVSSDEQTRGYSPQIQLEDSKRAAIERDGCTVKDEHILNDSKSGKNDNRPGWQKLMEIAKRKEIDVIYFWKLDRMMRSERHFYKNEEMLEELGIELRFATQDLSDPFTRNIQVAVAADERRKIRDRTYGGRIKALRDGKWVAQAPYGYFIDEKTHRLQINKKETEYVKRLFGWLVNERLSLQGLGKKAHIHRVPTKFDFEKKKKYKYGVGFWSTGALGRLLNREYYATGEAWFCKYKNSDRKRFSTAELRPEKDWIMVRVPQIIPQDLYEKAQKQLRLNSEFARRKTKRQYLFAKKLQCASCERKLTGSCRPEREGDKMYKGDRWADKKCSECVYYRERDLDEKIWDSIRQFFQTPDVFMKKLEKHRDNKSKVKEIEIEKRLLEELEAKTLNEEKRLLDFELSGSYRKQVILEKGEELEATLKNISNQKRELETLLLMEEKRLQSIVSAKVLYERLRERIKNPTYTIRQRIYRVLVKKIMLNRQMAEVWLNVPSKLAFPNFMASITAKEDKLLQTTPYPQ